MKNVAILASGSGSNAENIIKHFSDSKDVHIPFVLCNKKDAFVHERARNLGVKSMTFSKNELEQEFRGNITKKKNSADFIKFFPVTVELCEEILRHKNFQDVRRFVIQKTFNKKG